MNSNYTSARESYLAPYATSSSEAILLDNIANSDSNILQTPFERDKNLILSSVFLRKLSGKSQSLIFTKFGDSTSRLYHTLQVTEIAKKLAIGLNLNLDLTEAIALGHDIGHMPFSHNTQIAIDNLLKNKYFHKSNGIWQATFSSNISPDDIKNEFYITKEDGHFYSHQKQSFHLLFKHQPNSQKLTVNTLLGVLHNYEPKKIGIFGEDIEQQALSFEMLIVELADYLAWTNNDWDESVNKGFFSKEKFMSMKIDNGKTVKSLLGETYTERISHFIDDIINFNLHNQKLEKDGVKRGQKILMSPIFQKGLDILRKEFFAEVLGGAQIANRATIIQEATVDLFENMVNHVVNQSKIKQLTPQYFRQICDDIWGLSDAEFLFYLEKIGKTVHVTDSILIKDTQNV